jgi:very-short-patch-repair endonuclease
MRKEFVQPPSWSQVVRLAERQHGVLTRGQLLELGVSDFSIRRRIKDARLHRVHRGVYAVGRPTLAAKGRYLAAVVTCGPNAALSHFAAAALTNLMRERGPRIDVTVPRGGQRRRRGALIIHRAALPERDVTVKEGIRVTTPCRTIVDLADVLSERRLARVIDEAAYLRLDLTELRPRPGRRGSGILARILTTHEPGTTRTRSELEEQMVLLLQSFRLPTPEVNHRIDEDEVDFVWAEARLIVETDGWQAHGTRQAFERDRHRDAELVAKGWRVVRISYARLERDPDWVAARIGDALRAA